MVLVALNGQKTATFTLGGRKMSSGIKRGTAATVTSPANHGAKQVLPEQDISTLAHCGYLAALNKKLLAP